MNRLFSLLAGLIFAANTAFITSADTNLPPGESSPPGVRQVIIVFKTHFDIGYTDMASNILTKYRTTMIDQALQVADQNRSLPPEQQFAWTLPGWPMKQITETREQASGASNGAPVSYTHLTLPTSDLV